MNAPASLALDYHADLLDRLTTSEVFRSMLDAQAGMEVGAPYGRHGSPLAGVGDRLVVGLRVAETYRVTEEMSYVLQQAAATLDPLERWDHSLAPTGAGFVYLPTPLPLVDVRGEALLVNVIVWHPVATNRGPATAVHLFNDEQRSPDASARNKAADERIAGFARGHSGRWGPIGAQFVPDGVRLGPAGIPPTDEQAASLAEQGVIAHVGTNGLRYVHALWLMLGQTVTRVEAEVPERAARRRAGRAGLPGRVTVIRLRREVGGSRAEGESMVEWAHRWVVRGHWRRQPCGPDYPGAVEVEPGVWRARLWVSPFVKGPEGAPFKQSEKVYSLDR
jgi:hypothetical protein